MVISLFSARAGEKTTKTLDYFRKSSRWLNTVMPPIQTSDRVLLKYYLLFSFSNKRFCYSDLIVIFGQCFGNFYIRYLKHIIDFLARETYSNDSSNKAILQVKMVFKSMLTNGTYVFVIYLRKNLTFLDVLIRIFTNLKLIYILQAGKLNNISGYGRGPPLPVDFATWETTTSSSRSSTSRNSVSIKGQEVSLV